MQRVVDGAKSLLGRFSGGGNQETNDVISSSTINDITSSTDRLPPSDDLPNQELYEQRTGRVEKRAQMVEDQGPERKRVRQSRSERGSHLFESYHAPPSAQLIFPLTKEEEELRRDNDFKRPVKVGSGAPFRPRNTLNTTSHTARMGNGVSKNTAKRSEIVVGKLAHPSLDMMKVMGRNVQNASRYLPDGFRDDYDVPPKRRKLDNGGANSVPSNQHIDLTEDDSQQDQIVSATKRSIRDNSLSGSVLQDPSLNETVHSKVDKLTRTEPEKKKRKQRNSQGSSEMSARATPNGLRDSPQSNHMIAKQSLVRTTPHNDLAEVEFVSHSRRTEPDRAESVTTSRTSDRLSKKIRPGSEEDIEASNGLLNDDTRIRSKHFGKQKEWNPQHQQPRTDGKRSIEQTHGKMVPVVPRRLTEADDQPLNKKFIRESPDEKPPSRLRASQRMKATSRAQRDIGTAGDSEDELAGAKTIATQASRSASPQKTYAASVRHTKEQKADTAPLRSSSPSLKRTNFYGSASHNSETYSENKLASHSNDKLCIPVSSVFCRSCFLYGVDAELVWDSAENAFYVKFDERLQTVPNRDQLVRIGTREARQWFQAEREEILSVQIKGPQTINSNGSIIIAFNHPDGLSLCFQILLVASNESLRTTRLPQEKMRAIVANQGREIELDHEKAFRAKPPLDHREAELEAMQNRKARREIRQSDDDEEIRYENEDRQIYQTRRSRMQAGSQNEDETPCKPKQFTYQPARRSSRQTKPLKEKSPSPPPPLRWTQQNKLERWSHSVIYPPEGTTRRVTVDFQDLERLDEGEFLNDNIIGFALRRIEENMAPEHKDNVLFFNSFFYTALTTKSGKKAFNYDAVKRWTKSKDLFSLPYIVIPINIDLHWFVAIICNLPNLSRKAPALQDDPDNEPEMLLDALPGEDEERLRAADDISIADGDKATQDAQKSMRQLSLSDDDKIPTFDKASEVNAEREVHTPSSSRPSTAGGKKFRKKAPPRQRTFDPDAPTIITLDSFGSTHSVTARILKDYLNAEAEAKRGMEVTKDDLQGMTAKGIPEQTNFCDCGVYVVGYVEEFAKDPQKFVTKVLQKKLDQHSDFATFDPSAKRAEIRNELLKLHEVQEAERKAKKINKKSAPAVIGEASKIGETSLSAKAQAENEAITAQTKDLTAFVPLVPTAESLSEAVTSGQSEFKNETSNSASNNAESDELESEVPRALGSSRPPSREAEEALSSSPHTARADRGEDEVWNGISDSHSHLDDAQLTAAADNFPPALLAQLEEAINLSQNAAQNQPKQSPIANEGEQGQITSNVDRQAVDGPCNPIHTGREIIDVDGNEREPEIQDSQENEHY